MIAAEPVVRVGELAEVPARFVVDRTLDVARSGDGFRLTERVVADPWEKDYDAQPGEGPAAWRERFDLTAWGFLTAPGRPGIRALCRVGAVDRRAGIRPSSHRIAGQQRRGLPVLRPPGMHADRRDP